MKKFFKMLALVLALTLVIGTIPVSAATEVTLKKTTKTLYLDGCTGAKSTGKKAPYYSYAKLTKLLSNFDSKTMKVRATSDNTAVVKTSTTRITSVATGTANVTLKVYKGTVSAKNLVKTFTIKVTVKKNASASDLTYKGITDGGSYKVGDSITVQLPKGTDTDKRRLTVKSGSVTVKSSGTNKWKVTFNKEGSFELLAESYQSSTYKKATQSKTIKGTIKAAAKEDAPITVKQTALDAFTIDNVAAGLTKDDISLYTMIGSSQTPKNFLIDTVKVKDGVATVKMFSNLDAGTTYYVEVGKSKASFIAMEGKLADVRTVKITTEKAKVGIPTDITCSFLSAAGIDISNGIKSEISLSNLTFTIVDESGKTVDYTDVAYISGHQIVFNKAAKQVRVKATLLVGFNDKTFDPISCETVATISSYEDNVTGDLLYTLVKDDSHYMTEKDTLNHWFAQGDDICVEALFKYSDGSYKTFSEMGVTSLKSADPAVCMVMGSSASGGFTLVGNTVGSTTLIAYKGDTVINALKVEVRAARKADHFVVKAPSRLYLNTNLTVGDSLVFSAQAYDQYNEVLPSATFTAEQAPATITSTGTVGGLFFYANMLRIDGASVSLNPNPASGVIINITCDQIANCPPRSFTIYVKDVPATSDTTPIISLEGDAVINTTLTIGKQEFEPTYVALEHRSNGFFVSENVGRPFAEKPTGKLTNTSLGVADGAIVYGFTIEHNGKIIMPVTNTNVDYSAGAVEFYPIHLGKKLEKGGYVVSFYKIKAGTSYSVVDFVGSQQITVVDGEPDIVVSKKADNLSASLPAELNKFFNFYCDGVDIGGYITSADLQQSGDAAYIHSVTFTLPNDVVGTFTATVKVEQLINLK